MKNKYRIHSFLKNTLQWLLIVIGSIAFAISLRVFFLATFSIPTPSMEPAIMAGDQVVVSKLTPGPRIIRNLFSRSEGEEPDIKRLNGFAVKRNDVLIFNFPSHRDGRITVDMGLFYAKRCVAIPGDSFYIENGFYRVKGVEEVLGNYDNQRFVSERSREELEQVYYTYPYHGMFDWNIRNFGPLYVPRQGDRIAIDEGNVILYRHLIEYESQNTLTEKDGHYFLGDRSVSEYTFTKNYYFMTGDLARDSKDSRYWGLLPEEHIVGKVSFVWNTKDPHTGKKRWHRFLKKIK